MEQVLLVIQVILAVGLIGMVLIQRSESDGFGLGGGGGGVISGRAQANLMTRTTAIFAALFIINSLALSVLASQGRSSGSITDVIEQQQKTDAKGAPVVPTDADKKADKQLAVPMPEKKPVVKTVNDAAPAVPTEGADVKKDAPAADSKPVAPAVKKAVAKKAPKATDEPAPADNE
jgi:preprotein translocase subunit SecG